MTSSSADGLVDRMVCLRDGTARELGAAPDRLRDRYRARDGGGVDVNVVLRAAWLIARKDLVVEMRSRELVYTTLFFAVACVLVFAFAVHPRRAGRRARAGRHPLGRVAFSGTLALGRAFERERQAETLRALLLAPVERARSISASSPALLVLMAVGRSRARARRGAAVRGAALARAVAACRPARRRHVRLSRQWARCSPRCSCAPTRATCCCRSCCTR